MTIVEALELVLAQARQFEKDGILTDSETHIDCECGDFCGEVEGELTIKFNGKSITGEVDFGPND